MIGIARDDLLSALSESDAESDCFLGDVIDETGSLHPSCRTIVPRFGITIRGGKSSQFRFCKTCHRPQYLAIGEKYLVGSMRSVPRVVAHRGILLFRGDLAEMVGKRIRECEFDIVPWREQPMDSLPINLSDADRDLVLNPWMPKRRRKKR